MTTLARLRRISAAEIRWRGGVIARTGRDRVRHLLARPRWDRAALCAALSPELASAVVADAAHGDWMRVQATLTSRLRARPARFVLDPRTAPALRERILARWPGAAPDARLRADRILAGRYDLLGYRDLSFGTGRHPDWHLDPVHRRRAPLGFWADVPYLDPACGDHKIIWEINRHQHWLALSRALWLTQDPRYRRAIIEQLASWLAANPPLAGINWASMLEIGFRALSWTWALHALLAEAGTDDGTPWLVDLLVALDRQLVHVEENLSYYFSPNTHLTGEALALYVVGLALPELAASGRWTETGRRVLLAEMSRQIEPDGGHAERSTHYHRYTLDFYLLALLAARRAGDTGAAQHFEEAVGRLAVYMRALADDAGHVPLIGDDDGGMLWPFTGPAHADVRPSLGVAALGLGRADLAPWPVPEEAWWIAWPEARAVAGRGDGEDAGPPPPAARTMVFPDTGYVVMRDGEGGHLVFDVGPHGYLNGGHAHADALALTLTLAHRPVLVDPGTATYTMDRGLRDRLRLSTSHNTIDVDGRSSGRPAGPFHWERRSDARLHAWRATGQFGWAEAFHDAYAPVRHRRTVLRSPAGWLVVDQVSGTGPHRADAHWHFDPRWTVEAYGPGRLRARDSDGAVVWLVHDGRDAWLERGVAESALGWCSRSYGTIVPTWSARIGRAGPLPLVMAACLTAGRDAEPPALAPIDATGEAGGTPLAFQLTAGGLESWIVLRPGDVPVRPGRLSRAGPYRTDGRLLRVSCRDGRVCALDLADATEAQPIDDRGLGVSAAGEWMADLSLVISGETVEVWTSAPPPTLELRGPKTAGIRRVRLNGRDVPFRPAVRGAPLVVPAPGITVPAASATA